MIRMSRLVFYAASAKVPFRPCKARRPDYGERALRDRDAERQRAPLIQPRDNEDAHLDHATAPTASTIARSCLYVA